MNGLDFYFSPSTTVDASSTGNNGEDDDWGEFVDSSPSPNPNGFLNQNGADSTPNQNDSDKKSQAQWVTSRGPVPLSVFGEEEEEGDDESGASVSSFGFSFDSFSSKQNDGSGSVNRAVNSTNPNVGINGLIANLYRENGHNELNLPERNPGKLDNSGISRGVDEDLSSLNSRVENSAVSLENLSWNPLNLDTKSSIKTSNVVNSSTIGATLDTNCSALRYEDKNDDDDDDDLDGWDFKTADSMVQTANEGYMHQERENARSGSNVIQNTAKLNSSVWSSPANATTQNFDTGKIDVVQSVVDHEDGNDDSWDNGGWEFKVAEAGEPKKELKNKDSNGWSFEPVHKFHTNTTFQLTIDKEPQKWENGSISFPSNANANAGETSWAFEQPSLEVGPEKQGNDVQTEKPKGVLPLSFFEDEELGTSDTSAHEDNSVSVFSISVKEKTKAPTPTVSINDLISSLYSQSEEKSAVNLSENSDGYGFVSVKATTDSNVVNGEDDDSWEFQVPKKTIADGTDDFDSSWEFHGPSPAMKSSDVAEDVDEFEDDSWEFQGPTQPVKNSTLRKEDTGSWDYTISSTENEGQIQSSVPNGFGEFHEKPVSRIEPNDYKDLFHKLKIELCYIALNHLETLKEARDMAADSDEALKVQKCDGEIKDLQNWLRNDVLIGEINLEILQPKSSGIAELYKALQEPKFRSLDSEDLLTERLLLAEKDWKSTIELLKHSTVTLKILNLGSPEQWSNCISTWFAIASVCVQELQHAASIWKQVIRNDVQDEILSKPQGKSYVLSVGEIYRVVKILRASIRLYEPWILLASSSSNVLAVLDECVKLWLSSGLVEALLGHFNRQVLDHEDSAEQLLESIKHLDEIDSFTLHTCITSATSPTCCISGLTTDIVPGIKTVDWNGEYYLLPLANLWANLISRDPPSLPGHNSLTVS